MKETPRNQTPTPSKPQGHPDAGRISHNEGYAQETHTNAPQNQKVILTKEGSRTIRETPRNHTQTPPKPKGHPDAGRISDNEGNAQETHTNAPQNQKVILTKEGSRTIRETPRNHTQTPPKPKGHPDEGRISHNTGNAQELHTDAPKPKGHPDAGRISHSEGNIQEPHTNALQTKRSS